VKSEEEQQQVTKDVVFCFFGADKMQATCKRGFGFLLAVSQHCSGVTLHKHLFVHSIHVVNQNLILYAVIFCNYKVMMYSSEPRWSAIVQALEKLL